MRQKPPATQDSSWVKKVQEKPRPTVEKPTKDVQQHPKTESGPRK